MPLEGSFEPANPVHEQQVLPPINGAPGSPQTSGCLMGHIGARAPEPVCPLGRMAYGALAARGRVTTEGNPSQAYNYHGNQGRTAVRPARTRAAGLAGWAVYDAHR